MWKNIRSLLYITFKQFISGYVLRGSLLTKMIPKLFQWLAGVTLFLSVWLPCVLDFLKTDLLITYRTHVLLLPLYLIGSFGIYSLAVIVYRVAIFNDCVEASEELRKQIEEARVDLKNKGYKFDNS